MVDSVSIQPQVVIKKDNTIRNTAIAGSIGAVAGGVTGYIAKSLIKDGELTDGFVKELTDEILKSSSNGSAGYRAAKDLIKLDSNSSIDAFKSFIRKHAKVLELDGKKLEEELKLVDESFDYFGDYVEKDKNEIIEDINARTQAVKECYDSQSRKFNFDGLSKETKAIANKARFLLKGKSAAIWGSATAMILGFGTYVISKVTGHKDA